MRVSKNQHQLSFHLVLLRRMKMEAQFMIFECDWEGLNPKKLIFLTLKYVAKKYKFVKILIDNVAEMF